MFQPLAWEITTFVAVFHSPIVEQITSLLQEGAVLISWSTSRAVRHLDTLALYVVFEGKVLAAYSTIHPARSD